MKAPIIGTLVAAVIVFGLYFAIGGDEYKPTSRPAQSAPSEPALPSFKVQ